MVLELYDGHEGMTSKWLVIYRISYNLCDSRCTEEELYNCLVEVREPERILIRKK